MEQNEKRALLRSLMNVRMPAPETEEFFDVQDEYLTIYQALLS